MINSQYVAERSLDSRRDLDFEPNDLIPDYPLTENWGSTDLHTKNAPPIFRSWKSWKLTCPKLW